MEEVEGIVEGARRAGDDCGAVEKAADRSRSSAAGEKGAMGAGGSMGGGLPAMVDRYRIASARRGDLAGVGEEECYIPVPVPGEGRRRQAHEVGRRRGLLAGAARGEAFDLVLGLTRLIPACSRAFARPVRSFGLVSAWFGDTLGAKGKGNGKYLLWLGVPVPFHQVSY